MGRHREGNQERPSERASHKRRRCAKPSSFCARWWKSLTQGCAQVITLTPSKVALVFKERRAKM